MAQFTRDELKAEADRLEIEYNPRIKSEQLLGMVNALAGEEHTMADNAPKPAANVTTSSSVGAGTPPAPVETVPENAAATAIEADPEATIRCIIHSNDRENEEKMFEGNLNGTPVRVELGEEIDFPVKYRTLIQGAVVETKIPLLDEDGTPNGKYKDVRRPRYIIEQV